MPTVAPDQLVAHIAAGGRTAVALSGGVDSGVVAHLTARALGQDAIAVTLTGPSLAEIERTMARAVADSIGISYLELVADPLALPEYRANPTDRCYFCRRTEMAELTTWARDHAYPQLVDGVHADDLGDDRPGLRALDEAGVRHPLLWAGWGKREVRQYAREAGLPNWDRPSEACLASRIRHGEPITAELLARIETAEAEVRALGFRRVRVRVEGRSARVVVDPDEVVRLRSERVAREVERRLREAGFSEVALDPVGYGARAGA